VFLCEHTDKVLIFEPVSKDYSDIDGDGGHDDGGASDDVVDVCGGTGGVHTSKTTFGNKTPTGHGRVPSDDLVLGLPNLSAIQSSVSKMNVRPQRQQTDAAAASDTGISEPAAKAEYNSSDSIDGASTSSVDASVQQMNEHSGLSSPASSTSAAYPPPAVESVQNETTSSLPGLPPSLADLQNPATFSIQPSPKHGRKITKASFFDPSRPALGEATDESDGSADPLSKLDPLWSLKPTGKDSIDGEQS